jgi:PIN domain nuclease of toxin-antitoxin system
MIALLRRETGWEVVRDLLVDPGNTCLAHAVNLCEVFYDFHRGGGAAVAQSVIQDLAAIGILTRRDMGLAFWQEAGRFKADYRRVSLADCFCIALARRVSGALITSDHREFDPLVPLGLCPIRFIR